MFSIIIQTLFESFVFLIFFYGLLLIMILWSIIDYKENILNNKKPVSNFSIIIAFKDESNNIDNLLNSLQKLNYPKNLYEIILVNDHSTDNSEKIIKKYDFVQCINNYGIGKKKALQTGIKNANYDWIVTTDADCQVPKNWLLYIDNIIQEKNPKMILGAVKFSNINSFIGHFQKFEFLSLQAMTIAGVYYKHPFLSNGANLSFKKQVFFEVNGYDKHFNIASGDDVFLLENIFQKYPNEIVFIKNKKAIVKTFPQINLKLMFLQKIRWAKKTKYYTSKLPKIIGIINILTNIGIWVVLFASKYYTYTWIFIVIKFFFDTLVVFTMSKIYNTKFNILIWLIIFIIYPFYLFYLGLLILFQKNYEWKGRKYSY